MAALDVLIIGGGQAGFAMGYHLRQTPLRFQLVESNARLGDSWRKRSVAWLSAHHRCWG
jgi:putative flavoprotein involved in K+ transport